MGQVDRVASHALPYYGPSRGDACSGLWPLPRSCNCSGDMTPDKQPETGGTIGMDADHFQFVADNAAAKSSARLQRAFQRFHDHIFQPIRPHSQLQNQWASDSTLSLGSKGAPLFSLSVEVATDNETLALGVDESYSLSIETTVGWGSIGRLSAQTIWGALHGLESFSQLTVRTAGEPGSVTINSSYVFIEDAPRFPWRGIMIDTSRHWHPLSSIRTMINALSFNRMNVLHWHITDMQVINDLVADLGRPHPMRWYTDAVLTVCRGRVLLWW
jgi:hexosaminidase